MSLWKRITCTPESEQRMVQFYDEKGLLHLRICLAPWIEERIMSEQLTSNSREQYERIALKFHEDIQKKLIALRNDGILKYKASEIVTHIAQVPALELYTSIRNGVQKEIQLVTADGGHQMPHNSYNMRNASGAGMLGVGMSGLGYVAQNQLLSGGGVMPGVVMPMGIKASTSDLYEVHNNLQSMLAEFNTVYQEVKTFLQDFQVFQNYFATNQGQIDSSVEEQATLFFQRKPLILTTLRNYYSSYEGVQNRVISELNNWRRHQALAGNGALFNDNLDDIQRCFELLELFVGKLLECVRELYRYRIGGDDVEIPQLLDQVQMAQKSLVLSAFIVEKQPPQVMKTNTRFAAAVRWLIGSQLGIHMNPPTVECIILSEQQAHRFVSQRHDASGINPATQSSGEIQNNMSTMEYQQNSHIFSASFRNMQLKKIKRAEKKGTESVMDEKFALLFFAVTTVNDYQIRVWTLSLPVVVIVHGNQEPQSWATITWDNAFADIMREPFQVTDRVTWNQLSTALNTKFASSTGRPLTDENIEFLYEKLVRNDNTVGDHNEYISWAQFCKEPLPERTFTFWDWFFAIMKLTKDHLLNLWKAGRITGFINKHKAQEDLMRSNTGIGTFLLRFSDSELGGITVGFVNVTGQVVMLQPWTARDLNIRNLADRVHDLDMLRFLHPTDAIMQPMGRDEAFGEFYTQHTEQAPRVDGYVPSVIKVRVPASENGSLSVGNTPIHMMQSPHPQPENIPISKLCCPACKTLLKVHRIGAFNPSQPSYSNASRVHAYNNTVSTVSTDINCNTFNTSALKRSASTSNNTTSSTTDDFNMGIVYAQDAGVAAATATAFNGGTAVYFNNNSNNAISGFSSAQTSPNYATSTESTSPILSGIYSNTKSVAYSSGQQSESESDDGVDYASALEEYLHKTPSEQIVNEIWTIICDNVGDKNELGLNNGIENYLHPNANNNNCTKRSKI